MATQQVTPVTCPNCGTPYTAPTQDIINGQDMALKSALLQGRLNVAQCPQCGFSHPVDTPILYYDLEKEIAFVLAPGGLNRTSAETEKLIGNLTNKLVNTLPAEQRKFYLLNPKQFLSLDSMVKAILEADGINPEEMEAQQARVKLIEEFLRIEDEAALKARVKEREAELDRPFFEVLTASIQETHMTGNSTLAQALLGLRTALARWSPQARKVVAEIDREIGLVFIKSQEELLDKLQAAENDEEFEALIAGGYQLLDYGFFQKLTGQIDAATKANDTEKVTALKGLRTKILDAKDRQEAQVRAAMEKSTELLREILRSGQPEKVLAQKIDQIDETFFMLLSANIEEAQRQKQTQAVEAMTAIGNMAMQMLRDRMKEEEPEAEEEAEKPKIHIATR